MTEKSNKTASVKTYKVRLGFDDDNDRRFLVEMLSNVKNCWNLCSQTVFNEKTPLGLKDYHRACYRKARNAFPMLPSQTCINIRSAVLATYKAIRSNGQKIDNPAEMKRPSLQLDKRTYSSLTQKSIKLPSATRNKRCTAHFETYPKFEEMTRQHAMCDPKLCLDGGDIWLCVPFLMTLPQIADESALGIDLGVRRLATTSDGVAYTDRNYLSNRRRIRHNRRVLKQHRKHSHSARVKLAKTSRRERNVSKDMCHRLANRLLETDKSILVMEDLSNMKSGTSRIKGTNVKRTKHNSRLSQVPFYQLKTILSYKALHAGKRVETVSPYNTSKEDCRTQSTEGCTRRGCRFYTADGLVFDADWNAARNILGRKHPASFKDLPLDGRLNLVGRPCQLANGRTVSRLSGKPMPFTGVGS